MSYQHVARYEIKKDSPYYRELPTDEEWKEIYQTIVNDGVELLCQIDPSKAELIRTFPERYHDILFDSFYSEKIRDGYAGCHKVGDEIFEMCKFRNMNKLAIYMKFLYEYEMCKDELEKVPVKHPMFIVSMPRSGSSFTHRFLSAAPKARSVAIYQYSAPGNKLLSMEGRFKLAGSFIEGYFGKTEEEGKELQLTHAVEQLTHPEEDVFFQEHQGIQFLYGVPLPRVEQARARMFNEDYTKDFEDTFRVSKMIGLEKPFEEGEYFCIKTVTGFVHSSSMFKAYFKDEYEPRIVWIHREPVNAIKSGIMLYNSLRFGQEKDLGINDWEFFNEIVIEFQELCIKNGLAVRKQWIAENPERAKYICDVSFNDLTTDPVGTTKKIYEYFGMEWTEEIEKKVAYTAEFDHPQKNQGRKGYDSDKIVFNEDEVRERFKFYYEEFKEFLPNYWGKK